MTKFKRKLHRKNLGHLLHDTVVRAGQIKMARMVKIMTPMEKILITQVNDEGCASKQMITNVLRRKQALTFGVLKAIRQRQEI